MGTQFTIQQIFDEQGYPDANFLHDTEKMIASYDRPLRLSILELQRLYYKLKPIVENYEKWEQKRGLEDS